MSYAREDKLHKQIFNKEKKIIKLESKIRFLESRIKELLTQEDKRYETLFLTYIKVCERGVDYEDIITDLYNEILTLKHAEKK